MGARSKAVTVVLLRIQGFWDVQELVCQKDGGSSFPQNIGKFLPE
jgi:hypothetical protein